MASDLYGIEHSDVQTIAFAISSFRDEYFKPDFIKHGWDKISFISSRLDKRTLVNG